MNKPLDPMSVERVAKTETPSAAYVLRRRYGRARHAITVASWVTVINLLLQPVAVLAGTVYWDKDTTATWDWNAVGNWTGGAKPTSGDVAYFRNAANTATTTTIELSNNQSVSGMVFAMHRYNGNYNAVTITAGTPGGTLTIGSNGIWVDTPNGDNAYPGTVTINANVVLGASQTWSHYSNNGFTINGNVTGTTGQNYGLTVAGRGSATMAGVISDATAGVDKTTLTMLGNIAGSGSTLTLTGASTYTGNSTLTAGTLKLDFTQAGSPAPGTGIISSSSPLVLNGGTLQIVGDASADTQTFASTALNGGAAVTASTMNNASAYVDFGTITRTAPGTINFIRPTAGNIKVSNANDSSGIIGPWATAGATGADWAANDGSGNVAVYAGYTTGNAGSAWTSATVNYTSNNAAQTLGASGNTANTVKFTAGSGTLALAGNNLSVNGILNASGGLITLTSTGGKLGAAAGSEIVLTGPNNFQLNNALFADGTTTITKAGTGTLTANVASAFGAKTVNVTAGTLTSAAANYISGATVNVYALGTLSGNNAANSFNGATINLYPGGTISTLATTSGNNATLNLMSGTVYWPPADSAGFSGGTIRVNAGAIFTPVDPANWGQWFATWCTLTGASVELNGGDLNVQKGGQGPANYGGYIKVKDDSTFTGGECNVPRTTLNPPRNSARFQSLEFITVGKTFTIRQGAAQPNSGTAITFDTATIDNNGTLTFSSADSVAFSAMGAGSVSATLTKAGTGTLTISGTLAHTGAIKVSAGTLALNASMSSGTVVLDSGTMTSSAAGNTVKGFAYNSGSLNNTITIGAGGFIGGTGAIDSTTYGRLTQTAGATVGSGTGVAPGDPTAANTVGTLSTSGAFNYSMTNGCAFFLDIRDATTIANGTSHDYLNVTSGNLTIGTTPSMQVALYNGVVATDLVGKTFTFAHYSGTRSGAAASAWNVYMPGGSTVAWQGGSGSSWDSGANWNPSSYIGGTVSYDDSANKNLNITFSSLSTPAAASDVTISTGDPAVTGPSADKAVNTLTLGDGATTPSLTLQAGNLTVAGQTEVKTGASLITSSGAGGLITTSTLLVSGGSATLGSANNNVATANVTAGTLTVNGGTVSVVNLSGTGSLAGSQAVPQVNVTAGTPTFSGNATIMTVTGGTTTIGSGAKVATADLSAGTGTVNAVNPLMITGMLKLSGGIIAKLTGGISFTASNPADGSIVTDTARTFTLSGGTLTLIGSISETGALVTYNLNEGSGTAIANTGTGGATYNAITYGTGLSLSGSGGIGGSGCATFGNSGSAAALVLANKIDLTAATGSNGKYTASVWAYNLFGNNYATGFNMNNSGGAAGGGNQVSPYDAQIFNSGTSPHYLGLYSGSQYISSVDLASKKTDNTWHMYTVVGDGTDQKFYIDGVLVATCAGVVSKQNIQEIGGNSAVAGRNFASKIDSVNIFTTALSGADVASLHAGTYGVGPVNLPNTAIAATADSTLDLGAVTQNHILGNVTVTAGAGANTTLTVTNANKLTMGTLTIGINGANCGKLNLGTKGLTLGNGSVTKLAVTSVSPTVTGAICVAVAAAGSFSTGLNGTQLTDNTGKKWNVEVRAADGTTVDANGPQLWLVAASGGTAILFK